MKSHTKWRPHDSITADIEPLNDLFDCFSKFNWMYLMDEVDLYLINLFISQCISLPTVKVTKSHGNHKESLRSCEEKHFLRCVQVKTLAVVLHHSVSDKRPQIPNHGVAHFLLVDRRGAVRWVVLLLAKSRRMLHMVTWRRARGRRLLLFILHAIIFLLGSKW